MAAEQLVEGCVVTGRVIVPVPPVPVGTFRDEEFLVRRVVLRGREPRRGGVEGPSGIAELAPGTAVVVVAWPALTATVAMVVVPSLNVTVPSGVPDAAETAAVRVTVCPLTDEVGDGLSVVVVAVRGVVFRKALPTARSSALVAATSSTCR